MHCYDVHSGVTVCIILYEDVSSCMPLGCNGCLVKYLTADSDGFYPVVERMEEREANLIACVGFLSLSDGSSFFLQLT